MSTRRIQQKSAAAEELAAPTHDAIAVRAHELYVAAGAPEGHDLDFWLAAERELTPAVAGDPYLDLVQSAGAV